MAELNPSRSSETLVGNVSSEPEMNGKTIWIKGWVHNHKFVHTSPYKVQSDLIYLTDGLIRASSVTSVKASLDSQLEEAKLFTVKHTYVTLRWG